MEVVAETQPQDVGQPQIEQQQEAHPQEDSSAFAERFAHLTKKEKSVRDLEQQIKEERRRLQEERESFQGERLKFSKENLRKNPGQLLEEIGLKDEEFLEALLAHRDGKEIKPDPMSELDELKKQLAELKEEKKKEKESLQKQQEERIIAKFKENVSEFVKGKPEDFELINLYEAYDDVCDVIQEFYEANGRMIAVKPDGSPDVQKSYEVAANQVEKYYEEYIGKGTKAKRFSQAILEQESPQTQAPALDVKPKEQFVPRAPSATLTNRQPAAPPPVPSASGIPTKEESLKKAASLLRWK